MKATPLQRLKRTHADGMVEIAIWRAPESVPPCTHAYKYRLVYVVAGVRVVGFDNERGKGDHRHDRGVESVYRFTDLETLLADFWRAVAAIGDNA